MAIEYRFRLDEQYLEQAIGRFRRQSRWAGWFVAIKVLVALPLVGLVILFVRDKLFLPAALMAAFLVALALTARLDRWWAVRRFRNAPYYASEMTVGLSEEGIYARDRESESRSSWRTVTSGRGLQDGILFVENGERFRWLPDAATEAPRSEVEELVRRQLGERWVS